jgi:hypothetical protein
LLFIDSPSYAQWKAAAIIKMVELKTCMGYGLAYMVILEQQWRAEQ